MKISIKERLDEINRSTRWLSIVTEIPYSTLVRIVKGQDCSINIFHLDKICTALNCKLKDIVSIDLDEVTSKLVADEQMEQLKDAIDTCLKSLMIAKRLSPHHLQSEFDTVFELMDTTSKKVIEFKEHGKFDNKVNI